MEPAQILPTSSVLLAVAAAGGLVMAGIRFVGGRSPPLALVMLHGFLAAAATLCCTPPQRSDCPRWRSLRSRSFSPPPAAARFQTSHHWKQLPLPKWLVVTHAGAAVLGFVLPVAATWAARG